MDSDNLTPWLLGAVVLLLLWPKKDAPRQRPALPTTRPTQAGGRVISVAQAAGY